MMESQQPLFYEDIMDAINKTVNGNPKGLSIKQIAIDLWPARNPDTARSTLSRSLSSEHHDQNLTPEELDKVMDITGMPEHIIFYFCDKYGFERPAKRSADNFKKDIKQDLRHIADEIKTLNKKIDVLERMED